MSKKYNVVLGVFAALLWLGVTNAYGQSLTNQPQSDTAIPKEVEERILNRLKTARSELNFSDLKPSPMAGVYQLKVNGQVAFVSEDGGHLIAGEMYAVNGKTFVNLQEQERQQAEEAFAPQRAKMLSAVKKDDMVIYSPEKETKGFVYVFTDIDCGFCRKLHSQLDGFLGKGIEVRYLAFPRAGPNSNSAKKLATTWCGDNPQELMTRFKNGENVAIATCGDAPIVGQYMLGQEVGVRGTPAIVLENGQIIPGAVSPDYLAQAMGI